MTTTTNATTKVTRTSIKQQLIDNQKLLDDSLDLNLQGCFIKIKSNSSPLLDKLSDYFENCHVLNKQQSGDSDKVDIVIIAIESKPLNLGVVFTDWAREPGKSGRKDEYFDFDEGRLVRKVRTGMVFLQSKIDLIAVGPCIENDNQVINYINSQYMNWLQNRGWLICHASGMSLEIDNANSKGFAIAGLSGGGKSTLMLELMETELVSYVTNDRLFIKKQQHETEMLGIAKLPRINPGTIVGNPRLHGLLDPQQLENYQAMEKNELWHIEEKNDVPIIDIYGQHRLCYHTKLSIFIILNWRRDSQEETALTAINIKDREDALAAIMKSPGPFYQHDNGQFQTDDEEFDIANYLSNLSDIEIYEATGLIDFKKMSELILVALS
ncbi:MAG: HprK-related kinase B [Pseudomonadota bacterium]